MSDLSLPKSAYPRAYEEFDSSFINDSIEGDISLPHERFNPNQNETEDESTDSLVELIGNLNTLEDGSRKGSLSSGSKPMFIEPVSPKPRGYEFQLKTTKTKVYLTYPINSIEIDTYGKIEYEMSTREKSMVVIIPNSKGLSLNNQKLADAYSIRTGCVVALVDIYFNDPLSLEQELGKPVTDATWLGTFRRLSNGFTHNTTRHIWLQTHQIFGKHIEGTRFQGNTNFNIIKESIEELITTHGVENCILIGFSYGCNTVARINLELNVNHIHSEISEKIKGFVLVHPIKIPANIFDVLETSNKPTLGVFGQETDYISREELQHFQRHIEKNKQNKFIQLKTKKETPHGFSISGDYPPNKIGDLPKRTCELIVDWIIQKLNKYP
ncbi:hypothetical protein WICMUC_000974 [Wickerhamomyces mucosus]|uniref:Dienelactone hydrolase domain-containing protein n=1 Tax=Wickerhamomyces mucosus TaxID=1378264 RepID=A0A9P8THW5_9ASCO|nr:hypothetical protein WICMUC_000974 [Wickerhamomyces mucosus]